MQKPVVHLDWYEDGLESRENLWRLDPVKDVQVQLFAGVTDEGHYTGAFRLFVEHDVRDASGDQCVRYASWFSPIDSAQAVRLLAMPAAEAAKVLADVIREVTQRPNEIKRVAEFNHLCTMGLSASRFKPVPGPPMATSQRQNVKSHLLFCLDHGEAAKLYFNKHGERLIASPYERGLFRVHFDKAGKRTPLGSGPVDTRKWTPERKPFILPLPERLLVLACHALHLIPVTQLPDDVASDTCKLASLIDEYFRSRYGQQPHELRIAAF